MEYTLPDVEKYVDVLCCNDGSTEEWQQANEWILRWQHSQGVFDQCFAIITHEINSSNLNSHLMFISIKTLQNRVRFSFKEIPSDVLESILECLIGIVKIYSSQYESENSNGNQNIVIPPQLRYSLISICDIITITRSYFVEIKEMIPNCLKVLFLALFFEETQEKYLKSLAVTNALIQYDFVGYGIEFLSNSPMSTEWVECFGAIVSIIESFEMIVPLMPRLPETLTNINTISILHEILCNIYESAFQYKPFLTITVEFHIAYSQGLRQIADSDPRIHQFLHGLWSSYFKISLYELENTELLFASFQEFFEVASVLDVDVNLWAELLNHARIMFSEKSKNKELDSQMEPVKIIFFQLCSRQYIRLIELYCQYKSNQSENGDDNQFNELSPYLYDHIIKNLHTLSKKLLNHFLLEEDPKTIGLLKIAGMNAKFMDRDLLCKYADFALSSSQGINEGEVLAVCSFIHSSFDTIPEYIVPFISYEIQAFPIIPLHASYSLHYISKKYYENFLQVDADILNVLFNLIIKYGHNTSKANLILTILNIISHAVPLDFENPIFKQISLYCERFAIFAQNSLHSLKSFVDFIEYLSRFSQYSQLAFFYNQLSISMINSLGDVCRNLDNECQYQISLFFSYLLSRNWLKEYSIASEYVQQAIENGIVQIFHIKKIVLNLPLEFIPIKVFEVCNNAFAPATEVVSNKNMNVNIADLVCNEDAAEDVIDIISLLIFYIVQKHSFEHLSLFTPQLFTNIIFRTKSSDKCDHVYRTIDETIKLFESDEVPQEYPREILACILRGCTMKAFNCKSYGIRFLADPMLYLTKLVPQDEYVELFLGAIPSASLQSVNNDGNNPAMNYLNAIFNPCLPIDFSNAISNFVTFVTKTAGEQVQ